MSAKFFTPRPDANPTIYAYELPGVASHKGLLKVGYTSRTLSKNKFLTGHTPTNKGLKKTGLPFLWRGRGVIPILMLRCQEW